MSTPIQKYISGKVPVSGHVKVAVIYPDGTEAVFYDDHNLIVNQGLVVLTELLGQGAVGVQPATQNNVYYICVGSGTNTPLVTDTTLQTFTTGQVIGSNVALSTSPFSVTYQVTFPTVDGMGRDANGTNITEVGLYTAGNSPLLLPPSNAQSRMIARQVIGSIAKTSSIAVQITWALIFT